MLKTKLNPPARKGRRNWSEAQRRVQAQIIRARRPWQLSTGPKTIDGKKASSQNALKNGMHSKTTLKFKQFMRLQRKLLKAAKAQERLRRMKRRLVLSIIEQGLTFEQYKEMREKKLCLTSHPSFRRDANLGTVAT